MLVPENAQRRSDTLLTGKASGLQNFSNCSRQPLFIVGLLILLCPAFMRGLQWLKLRRSSSKAAGQAVLHNSVPAGAPTCDHCSDCCAQRRQLHLTVLL